MEVYEKVYGNDWVAEGDLESIMQRIYEPNATYENPLITATSRQMITDIHRISRTCSELDMPTPLSLAASSLRGASGLRRWFRVLRVWSEISDICETESFDGHRKSVVEHSLHFLFLPGLHGGRTGRLTYPTATAASESSLDMVSSNMLYSIPHFQRTSDPSLALPGTKLSWPSPLHFELRILSRIEFNGERVLHHRDIWDIKDLMALVPGAKLVQYIGTRLTARALTTIGNLGAWLWGGHVAHPHSASTGGEAATTYSADNCLGLLDIDKDCPREL